MTRLEKIEKSIEGLTPEELDAFADWFEALQANRWDKRLEPALNHHATAAFWQAFLSHPTPP